jgi:NADP-dependent 3-hydroxy acid dehydrogenase YdfG
MRDEKVALITGASSILHAVEQPGRVTVAEIAVRPATQEM